MPGDVDALDTIAGLLHSDDVDMIDISAPDRGMRVRFSDDRIEIRPYPFKTNTDLVVTVQRLCDMSTPSQQFDRDHPSVDAWLGVRWWLLAGHPAVVTPSYLCLRSNMAGRKSLAELDVASVDLRAVLTEAISGQC